MRKFLHGRSACSSSAPSGFSSSSCWSSPASYRWLIGRPLSIIIRTIDEFQTGQYVKRIPIVRRDEWGQLAEHFNSMAQEIEQVL